MDKNLIKFIDELIGIPYKINGRTRKGIDCFGLVLLFYKEFLDKDLEDGVEELPSKWYEQDGYAEYKRYLLFSRGIFTDKPDTYDLALMGKGKVIDHIGIFLPGNKILNTNEKVGVCVSPCGVVRRAGMLKGFFKIK